MADLAELFKTTYQDDFTGETEFNVADGLRMIGLALHRIADQLGRLRDVIENR